MQCSAIFRNGTFFLNKVAYWSPESPSPFIDNFPHADPHLICRNQTEKQEKFKRIKVPTATRKAAWQLGKILWCYLQAEYHSYSAISVIESDPGAT